MKTYLHFYLKLNLNLKDQFLGNCSKTIYNWKGNKILRLQIILNGLNTLV